MEKAKNLSISTRYAKHHDSQFIAEFNQAMALETEDKYLEDSIILKGVTRMVNDQSLGFYLVAEVEGRVVGCLGITYEWSDWRNGLFWWIQSVYVLPEYRRSGVFARMYQHINELALNETEVCGIRLYVESDNVRARSTYLALGMSMTHYNLLEVEFNKSEV